MQTVNGKRLNLDKISVFNSNGIPVLWSPPTNAREALLPLDNLVALDNVHMC